jgi:queuine/archaeosine tRNA-ribosyltransferase
MFVYMTLDHVAYIKYVDNMCWSFKQLRKRKKELPKCKGLFLMDSAGFTELSDNGYYSFDIDEYLRCVRRFAPDYFVNMDWMCEPTIIQKTEKTVRLHIALTVENYQNMVKKMSEDEIKRCIPVIQGWGILDYFYCIEKYEEKGLLAPYMGIGSVCRRNSTHEIAKIISMIKGELPNVKLHGFGIKKSVIDLLPNNVLHSIDSAAYMFQKKHNGRWVTSKNGIDIALHEMQNDIKKRQNKKDLQRDFDSPIDYRWKNLCEGV